MRSLLRALRAEHRYVPVPWPSLAAIIRPGPGHLLLVIADPSVGKSAFALTWALKAQVPALYLSWDTDLFTQGVRTATALEEKVTTEQVEEDPKGWADWLEAQDMKVRFVDLDLDQSEMEELVLAENDYWNLGLVIVDVLGDIVAGQNVEAYDETLNYLKRLARKADALVMVLHHLRRDSSKASGADAPSLDRARYAGDRPPEFALGLWTPVDHELGVAVLKNRMGFSRPDGSKYITLTRDIGQMKLEEQ